VSDYLKELRVVLGKRLLIVPGVRAIILRNEKEILLQHRKDMGMWGLPGGAIEPDETPLSALKREVKEETSIIIDEAKAMALYCGPSQRFTYPNGDRVQGHSVAFIVSKWSGRPLPDGGEGLALEFFTIEELPENIVPIHRKTIEDYLFHYHGEFLVID